MSYFAATESHDQSLIHSSVRDHGELETVARHVEAEVIDHFTEPGEDGSATPAAGELFSFEEHGEWFTVRLTGYHSDASLASGYNADRPLWSGLARALRQVIADVISHRLRHYALEAGLKSVKVGRVTHTYDTQVDSKWPVDWSAGLARYRRVDYLVMI